MPHEWEIWLDANLSPILAKWLADYTGLNVKLAFYLSLEKREDLYIYRKAKAHGHVIIISKDSDFPEIISKWGSPPSLINIKVRN
jgi:predicted nuclease of predicted toxin-antitoxin system